MKNKNLSIVLMLIIIIILIIAIVAAFNWFLSSGNNNTETSNKNEMTLKDIYDISQEQADEVTQKAQNSKRMNEINTLKDEIVLSIANIQQEYYEKYQSKGDLTYKNAKEYILKQLENNKDIVENVYIEILGDTVIVYSDSKKNDKLLQGTINENGYIQWEKNDN